MHTYKPLFHICIIWPGRTTKKLLSILIRCQIFSVKKKRIKWSHNSNQLMKDSPILLLNPSLSLEGWIMFHTLRIMIGYFFRRMLVMALFIENYYQRLVLRVQPLVSECHTYGNLMQIKQSLRNISTDLDYNWKVRLYV